MDDMECMKEDVVARLHELTDVDFPTFDKWYRKTHKKVYPVTVKGIPSVEEAEIQTEAEKVSEERWKKTC